MLNEIVTPMVNSRTFLGTKYQALSLNSDVQSERRSLKYLSCFNTIRLFNTRKLTLKEVHAKNL